MSINMTFTSAHRKSLLYKSPLHKSPLQMFIRDIRYFNAIRGIRRRRTGTIDSALNLVNRRHATFSSLGFDRAFLENEAASLLELYLYHGEIPRAEELACLWAEHFLVKGKAKHSLVRRVLPMMSDFVYLLETEAEKVTIPRPLAPSSLHRDIALQA